MIAPTTYSRWKQEAIETVSQDGMRLTDEWSDDYDIVEAAVRNNPLAIKLAINYRDHRPLAMIAVSINGLAYFWLSDKLKRDKEIIYLFRRTLPRLYRGLTGSRSSRRTIYYASSKYCPALAVLAGYTDIFDEFVPTSPLRNKCSGFLRDSHVCLIRGGSLLPHLVYDKYYRLVLLSLLPEIAFHLLLDPITQKASGIDLGTGYYTKNVMQAMLMSYQHKTPFKIGKSCIEGGNALTFIIGTRPVMIIGETSLYFSYITLANSGYFEAKTCPHPPLDKESYRRARNIARYEAIMATGLLPPAIETSYRKSLMGQVHEKDMPRLEGLAARIEECLQLTKEKIALDTEIGLDNIVFLPQKYFHIDLDTLVTPNGEVIMHDESTTISFLNHLLLDIALSNQEKSLIEDYLKTATENEFRFRDIMQARKMRLNEKHIPYRLMPFSFVSKKYESHLNYCNGLFVRRAEVVEGVKYPCENFIFLTTGPSHAHETIVHARVHGLFASIYPQYTFRAIEGLSLYISKTSGGLRCLTYETLPAFDLNP